MPSYLVEAFLSRVDSSDRRARDRATRSAAQTATQDGTPIRYFGSIYVPEDEICLFSFDAPSPDDVARVAERAGLRLLRVLEAVHSDAEPALTPTAMGPSAARRMRGSQR